MIIYAVNQEMYNGIKTFEYFINRELSEKYLVRLFKKEIARLKRLKNPPSGRIESIKKYESDILEIKIKRIFTYGHYITEIDVKEKLKI